MNNYEAQYRKEINSYLKCGEDNIYFYWKGRVALYALLKAMGVGPGDEVIVQGYTCVVVANSIIYLLSISTGVILCSLVPDRCIPYQAQQTQYGTLWQCRQRRRIP